MLSLPMTREFWEAVRPADLLDVLIVAAVLSVVLGWLKRRATRPLLVAVAAGVLVYAVAGWFDLYLTLLLFRVGLVVLLASALVAYQEDVRRGFESLVAGRWSGHSEPTDGAAEAVAVLTEAAFDFAERRVGALVVFRGSEHLDPHLRGGWEIDGRPSVPLLQSVFDPASPGHDGAAVIGPDGRLERFGAHLPLSSNLAEIFGHGTRHAAALGLSERTDALVLVVSEERGTVTLARDDRLEPIAEPKDLAITLQAFFDRGRPHPAAPAWRPKDIEVKVAAVGLAAVLWLALAAPTEPFRQTFFVPVVLQNVKDDWTLDGPYPDKARVTLVGTAPAFRELSPNDLRLVFDAAGLSDGPNELSGEDGRLSLPDRVKVAGISPEKFGITAHPRDAGIPPP